MNAGTNSTALQRCFFRVLYVGMFRGPINVRTYCTALSIPLVKQSMFVPPPGTSTARFVVSPPAIALAGRFVNPPPFPVKFVLDTVPTVSFLGMVTAPDTSSTPKAHCQFVLRTIHTLGT